MHHEARLWQTHLHVDGQHKKLISHENIAEIKEMTKGIEEFDKIDVKVFTMSSTKN